MSASESIQRALLAPLENTNCARVGPFLVLLDETSDNVFRNYAAPASPEPATDADIAALTEYFRSHDRRPRLEYVEPQPALTAALLDGGYVVERHLPLLVLGRDGVVTAPVVDGIAVGAAEDLLDAAAVMGVAYDDPEPAEDGAARLQRTLDAGGWVAVALDVGTGRAVGAGLHTAPVHGMSELAAVATLPQFRRRGIAAAVAAELTRHAVAVGAQPFLQAEGEAEARIYNRIGYERCGSLVLANHISG